MVTIVLLAEHELTDHDVARVAHLHDPEPVRVHVVVPADTESGHVDADETRSAADAALRASVAALTAAGIDADGELTPRDPLPAVHAAVAHLDADEVLVVTPPHLLQEALHRDWASRLRGDVGRPVLHVVSGTDRVVS